ncbi:MAG: glycosyltransferase, partial [Chloroflexi bacterium]|nr:glycosyltransferase [Chloroflexota bacterium]
IAARLPDQPLLMVALGDTGVSETIGNAELRFVPYEPDQGRLAAWYQAADLYLHAARADNLPTTILEALASGRPVVATAIGGIPEEVRSLAGAAGAWAGPAEPVDDATGVLVAPGDAEGMAAAATEIIADASLWGRLSANAARDAAARFDLDAHVSATIDWYREVIEDWRGWVARGRLRRAPPGAVTG